MTSNSLALLGLILACLLSASQEIPKPQAAFETRLRHAQESLEEGDTRAASSHAQAALVLDPYSSAAFELLLSSCEGDRDSRTLWAQRAWASLADAVGEAPRRSKLARRLESLAPFAPALAAARAEACAELAKLAKTESKRSKRSPSHALVADWAAQLGGRLARDSPQLAAAHAQAFATRFESGERTHRSVLEALQRLRSGAHARSQYELAVRTALIVRGLAAQGSDNDLHGPLPAGIDGLQRKASEALLESRHKLEARFPAALSLEELQAMEEPEARAFSLAHTSLAKPAIALSRTGRYRIETSCGYETLIGVARSVERHHERLALWFGKDPFLDQEGLIRVLPEAAGLETEGSPHWWAGGFQSGHVTTARFSCSSIEAFGSLLTHELTHRFDAALYEGLPSWLAEGKAVWTGGSYESSRAEEFVEDHIDFGTVERAWMMGYGAQQKLRDLIESEIEEYRDNYVAGYALFVYLKLWQEPEASYVYAPRLEAYMQGLARHAKSPLAWFSEAFADGEAGRPADFVAFAEGFGDFLSGFYWDDRAAWTQRYEPDLRRSGGGWVYDSATWSWSRQRAEAFWGQDHAQAAGDLFSAEGQVQHALAAYLWAWSVDERSARLARKLAGALELAGQPEAAWVVRKAFEQEGHEARAASSAAAGSPLALPKTLYYTAELQRVAHEQQQAGLLYTATALAADAARLERSLGQWPAPIEAPPERPAARHPWDRPTQLLGLAGWEEAGLTGFEARRAPGCWYVEPDGDLHVGRFRPRGNTGTLDRRAHNRHAYARTRDAQEPGRYALSCRVQFTTSYVSAALILGDTRRDRNIRLHFSAGDFLYSIGKSEEAEELDSLHWRVDGLRERDGGLDGTRPQGKLQFDTPRTNFVLLAIVDGASAHFWIEGQYLGAYHDALGIPIEGHLGFATGQGAVRIIEPTIQRLDRSGEVRRALPLDSGQRPVNASLDLAAPPRTSFRALRNLPVRGITPRPMGSLLVWVPMEEWSAELAPLALGELQHKAEKWAAQLRAMLERARAQTPLVFAVPDKWPAEELDSLRDVLGAVLEPLEVSVVSYAWRAADPTRLSEPSGAGRSWLCFVDSAGVLRSIDRFYGFKRKLPDEILHWVTVFRDEESPPGAQPCAAGAPDQSSR